MTNRILAAASVAALSISVGFTGLAVAQSQQRQQVAEQLQEHQISVPNLGELTDTQVGQIQLILNTTEADRYKAEMVNQVIAEPGTCQANAQMRETVAKQLPEHGIRVDNFENVSGSELLLMNAVLSTSAPDTEKAAMIQGIFDSDAPVTGNDQLRSEVAQCVQSVNADVNIDALTPAQLLEIELVSGGNEPETQKRQMIENIANQ